ncbi:DUF3862 domain-containing protein [Lentilactobacillus senioris]|uniref:DUF3862 domain-containing protein n=1 Tax=Lentilactobacillus senioris TaxID=931534 RepID=UPI00227EFB68|nr:DUF3862 domain-containing protein [Lentilactobacillus senioris]MCY9807491.1 DUF3862 domain-containing protein [Lentilactobacillus senioris]
MRKTVTIAATLLSILTLSACGNTSSKSSSTSSDSEKTEQKKTEKNTITLTKYNKIKVGNSLTGAGGTDEKVVKSMYGKPESKSETAVPGASKKGTSYSWSNVGTSLKGAAVTTEFLDGKTVAKGYTNFESSPEVTNAKYKSIKLGQSYISVKHKLGTPITESIAGSGTTSAQTLTYSNGTKSIVLIFTNNKLSSKTFSEL